MDYEKFKTVKSVRLKGCTQKMTLVSVDLDAKTGVCKWTDSKIPKIHQEVFNLSDLISAEMNINLADIENSFRTQPKIM